VDFVVIMDFVGTADPLNFMITTKSMITRWAGEDQDHVTG